ncbi:hypothetical protein LFM09_08435 [Lentzea alba]
MTDPVNPEAPHSPGTPQLSDLDYEEPRIPEETPAEPEINEPGDQEQPD